MLLQVCSWGANSLNSRSTKTCIRFLHFVNLIYKLTGDRNTSWWVRSWCCFAVLAGHYVHYLFLVCTHTPTEAQTYTSPCNLPWELGIGNLVLSSTMLTTMQLVAYHTHSQTQNRLLRCLQRANIPPIPSHTQSSAHTLCTSMVWRCF